jgi:hypothetical protein
VGIEDAEDMHIEAVTERSAIETGMMTMTRIQLHGPISVDAMAPTPRNVLDRLRELLAAGVDASPDEHRPNFYTVGDQNSRIYFYISPISAKVWVLEAHMTPTAPTAPTARTAAA